MQHSENKSELDHVVIEVFYDGGCPLCRREMGLLKRWDRRLQIRFSDISDIAFDPRAIGKTHEELMARMHGRLADGAWLQGIEVFRQLYEAVGFGPIVFLSRLPVVSQLLDFGYSIFARHRLRLTGRCTTVSCSFRKPADCQ